MNKKEIKKIREILSTKEVKFTCGITRKGLEETEQVYKINHRKLGLSYGLSSIYEDTVFGQGMNVRKFGPTCVTLYSYDMLGRKIVGKIKYEDVKIIKNEENV